MKNTNFDYNALRERRVLISTMHRWANSINIKKTLWARIIPHTIRASIFPSSSEARFIVLGWQ
jgi:hypothetical protein